MYKKKFCKINPQGQQLPINVPRDVQPSNRRVTVKLPSSLNQCQPIPPQRSPTELQHINDQLGLQAFSLTWLTSLYKYTSIIKPNLPNFHRSTNVIQTFALLCCDKWSNCEWSLLRSAATSEAIASEAKVAKTKHRSHHCIANGIGIESNGHKVFQSPKHLCRQPASSRVLFRSCPDLAPVFVPNIEPRPATRVVGLKRHITLDTFSSKLPSS
jgi:hypothetical protein